MLIEKIKSEIRKATLSQSKSRLAILKVALGEIQLAESRDGSITDEKAEKLVAKIVQNNAESIPKYSEGDPRREGLIEENKILEEFIRKTLSVEEIKTVITTEPTLSLIKEAKSAGQAIGVAMKALKQIGANVSGADVAQAVNYVHGIANL